MPTETTNPNQPSQVSVLTTDTVGFSARLADDETKTIQLLQRDLKWFQEVCQYFGGQTLKDCGDGLVMCFSSPKQAVSCAMHLQKDLVNNWIEGDPSNFLQHRFGIHTGNLYWKGADLIGDAYLVSRLLMSIAEPNAIIASSTSLDGFQPPTSVIVKDIGKPILRHTDYQEQTFEIFSSRSVIETSASIPSHELQELPFGPKAGVALETQSTPSERLRLRPRKRFSTLYYTQTIKLLKFHRIDDLTLSVKGHYPTVFAVIKQIASPYLPIELESDLSKGILTLQAPSSIPLLKPNDSDVIHFLIYASGSGLILQLDVPTRKRMLHIASLIIAELTARPIAPSSFLKSKVANPGATPPALQNAS